MFFRQFQGFLPGFQPLVAVPEDPPPAFQQPAFLDQVPEHCGGDAFSFQLPGACGVPGQQKVQGSQLAFAPDLSVFPCGQPFRCCCKGPLCFFPQFVFHIVGKDHRLLGDQSLQGRLSSREIPDGPPGLGTLQGQEIVQFLFLRSKPGHFRHWDVFPHCRQAFPARDEQPQGLRQGAQVVLGQPVGGGQHFTVEPGFRPHHIGNVLQFPGQIRAPVLFHNETFQQLLAERHHHPPALAQEIQGLGHMVGELPKNVFGRQIDGNLCVFHLIPVLFSAHPLYPAVPRANPHPSGRNGHRQQSGGKWAGADPGSG